MLTVRGETDFEGWTLEELRALPTLCTGQADDLKIDQGERRVWLSRCGVEDGEPFENKLTVEQYVDGRWQDVAIYEMQEG